MRNLKEKRLYSVQLNTTLFITQGAVPSDGLIEEEEEGEEEEEEEEEILTAPNPHRP